jgi:oligoribonuclease
MDMEMTGLNVDHEVIIEVAALVTDLKFKELDLYHAIVNQPQIYLENMDDWNQSHHKDSGLLALIPSGKSPDVVENDLLEFLDRHFKDEKAIIAGNSIGQDRLFIDRYFTQFSQRLHYRMLDVSSWKLIFNNVYQLKYEKKSAHRALDDINESIAELKFYMEHIKA